MEENSKSFGLVQEIEEQIIQLVAEACKHKPGSNGRQRVLTQIIRLIIKSGKLWKDSSPYYEDALQQTWIYFCRNLCESTTGDKYDPNRGSPITWLNAYLKRRLQDGHIEANFNQAQSAVMKIWATDKLVDLMETLEAPPDIPPILETTRRWAWADPDGELRRIHIQERPDVTCQVLILQRLPPEIQWEKLSTEFGLAVPTLSSFYQRQCLPRLREFGKSQGYL